MVQDVIAGIQEDLFGHPPNYVPVEQPTTAENIKQATQISNYIIAYNTTQQQMLQQIQKIMHKIQVQL